MRGSEQVDVAAFKAGENAGWQSAALPDGQTVGGLTVQVIEQRLAGCFRMMTAEFGSAPRSTASGPPDAGEGSRPLISGGS